VLYYEKQALISGRRLENGYRVYRDRDVQRIRLIQQLQAGGLTLKECKVCLEAKVDRKLLQNRLRTLDEEIERKLQSRQLLSAMLGEGDLKAWHGDLDKMAPDAHLDWLIKQGFSEKEALRLKWLSKDMNEHDVYMADFMKVFQELERWGPGSESESEKALSLVPISPNNILEIGCGKGLATRVLAERSEAKIVAIDNEQPALDSLTTRFKEIGLSDRLKTVCASMTELPFSTESFDLIWAEGSAYIMGIERALKEWKPFLASQGCLMISDMVWRTDRPSLEPLGLWETEYPDMQSVNTRIDQMTKAGYRVVEHFALNEEAWMNYYGPLRERVVELETQMTSSKALQDIKQEVDVCTRFADEFGYHIFILQKLD
jgi:DNA-binding transcriptional MerR regulator/predicted SAM-dependent methyltransferase